MKPPAQPLVIDVVGQRFQDELRAAEVKRQDEVRARAKAAGIELSELRFTLKEVRSLYQAGYDTGYEAGADGGSFEQALLDLDSWHR